MTVYFGAGRPQLEDTDWNISVNSSSGNLSANTYTFSLQAKNRIGKNFHIESGIISIQNGDSIDITINSSALKEGEDWSRYVIGIKSNSDNYFKHLCYLESRNPNDVSSRFNFPYTVTFTQDWQLTPGYNFDNLPTTNLIHGYRARYGGYIYEYNYYDNVNEENSPILIVDNNNRWNVRGTLNTEIGTLESSGGCYQDINFTTEYDDIELIIYEGDGLESPRVSYWLDDPESEIQQGTFIRAEVYVDNDNVTDSFKDRIIFEPIGIVNKDTGELRKTKNGDVFSQVDREILLGEEQLFVEDNIAKNEVYAVYASLNFYFSDVKQFLLSGIPIRIYLTFSTRSSQYSPVNKLLGDDVIYPEQDLRRIVPLTGLSIRALAGSGIINNYGFSNVPSVDISGLDINSNDQKIVINDNGGIYYEPSTTISQGARLRASISTEILESKAYDAGSISVNEDDLIEFTITFPTSIRNDYDDVIAGNSKGKFNAEEINVYIDNGVETRVFTFTVPIDQVSETYQIINFSDGVVFSGTINTTTENGLFTPNSITPIADIGGELSAGNYSIKYSFQYLGNTVSNISHSDSVDGYSPIKEQLSTLLNVTNNAAYYQAPYTLAELKNLDDTAYQEGTEFKFKHSSGIYSVILEKANTSTDDDFNIILTNSGTGRFVNKSVALGDAGGDLTDQYPNPTLISRGLGTSTKYFGHHEVVLDDKGIITSITSPSSPITTSPDTYKSPILTMGEHGEILDISEGNEIISPTTINSRGIKGVNNKGSIDDENNNILIYCEVAGDNGSSFHFEIFRNNETSNLDIIYPSSDTVNYPIEINTFSGIQTLKFKFTKKATDANMDLKIRAINIGGYSLDLSSLFNDDNPGLQNDSSHPWIGTYDGTSNYITLENGFDVLNIDESSTFTLNIDVKNEQELSKLDLLSISSKYESSSSLNLEWYADCDSNNFVNLTSGRSPLEQDMFNNYLRDIEGEESTSWNSFSLSNLHYGENILFLRAWKGTNNVVGSNKIWFKNITLSNGEVLSFSKISIDNYVINDNNAWTAYESDTDPETGNTADLLSIDFSNLNLWESSVYAIKLYLEPPLGNTLIQDEGTKHTENISITSNKAYIRQALNKVVYGKHNFNKEQELLTNESIVPYIKSNLYSEKWNTETYNSIPLKFYYNHTKTTSNSYFKVYWNNTEIINSSITEGWIEYSNNVEDYGNNILQFIFYSDYESDSNNNIVQIRNLRIGEYIYHSVDDLTQSFGSIVWTNDTSNDNVDFSISGNSGNGSSRFDQGHLLISTNNKRYPEYSYISSSTFSFDYKTSCSGNHYLYVWVNNELVQSASGSTSWTTNNSAKVYPGLNYLLFAYEKDSSSNLGEDEVAIANLNYSGMDLLEINEFTYQNNKLTKVDNSYTLKDGNTGKAIRNYNLLNDTSEVPKEYTVYRILYFYVPEFNNNLLLPNNTNEKKLTSNNDIVLQNDSEVLYKINSQKVDLKLLDTHTYHLDKDIGILNVQDSYEYPFKGTDLYTILKFVITTTSDNDDCQFKLWINGELINTTTGTQTDTEIYSSSLLEGIYDIYIEFLSITGEDTCTIKEFSRNKSFQDINIPLDSDLGINYTNFSLSGNTLVSSNLNQGERAFLNMKVNLKEKEREQLLNTVVENWDDNYTLSFSYKYNTTTNNTARVYLNDSLTLNKTGLQSTWTQYSGNIKPGYNTLKIEYNKTESHSSDYFRIADLQLAYIKIDSQELCDYGSFTLKGRKFPTDSNLRFVDISDTLPDSSTGYTISTPNMDSYIGKVWIELYVYLDKPNNQLKLFNDKIIYTKTGTCNLPNNSTTTTSHTISNLDEVIDIKIFSKNSSNNRRIYWDVEIDNTNISVTDSRDNTGYSGNYIMKYTLN